MFFPSQASCYFCGMTIQFLCVGDTESAALQSLLEEYERRLSFYVRFEREIIPGHTSDKNEREIRQKEKQGEQLLKKLLPADMVVLLDEGGTQYTSVGFSEYMQKKLNSGVKRLVFVSGGAYGFSEAVYKRAQERLSLSKMTFSHQMVRLFFVEQLYRAFTILRNERYHHR